MTRSHPTPERSTHAIARPRGAFAARALAVAIAFAPAVAAAQGAAPTAADAKSATLHFERGVTFFKAQKFGDALAEFRASYAALPSPNSHLYVARCLAQSGDLSAAFDEFATVVAEAETRALGEAKYAPTRDTARLERDELAEKIALVSFTITGAAPGATLDVAGRRVAPSEWSKARPFKPGTVEIVVRDPSGAATTRSVQLAAGQRGAVSIDVSAAAPAQTAAPVAAPPPPPKSDAASSRTWMRPAAFVAGGVGAAGLVMFAVGGAIANGTYSKLKSECGGPCPADRASDVSAGKTEQTVANVGLALGVVGVAAGVTLFVLAPRSTEPARPSTALVLGPSWSGVTGTF
jgi:hypothetical protein